MGWLLYGIFVHNLYFRYWAEQYRSLLKTGYEMILANSALRATLVDRVTY